MSMFSQGPITDAADGRRQLREKVELTRSAPAYALQFHGYEELRAVLAAYMAPLPSSGLGFVLGTILASYQPGMSEEAFAALLEEWGIHFAPPQPAEEISVAA